MPKVKIMLYVLKSVHSERPLKGDEKHWDPLSCIMEKQHQVKFDEGHYVIRARIEQRLFEDHGIMQILNPEDFAVVSDGGFFDTEKDSLLGSFLKCYVCDNKKIKFYVLHSKSMITDLNIFGIPSFVRSAGELKFCDFNLIQVVSCSKCGFSSHDKEHFKRMETSEPTFSVEEFSKGWEEKIEPLLKKAQEIGEPFYGEDRDTQQAILSYDLAIATFEQMVSIASNDEKKGAALRKKASMLMVQAEMLMESQNRDAAEENLKKVVDALEPVFESLKGVEIMRTCVLLFQIKIYVNDLQSAAQYMKFLDNYDPDKKLKEGTEEYKELKVSSAKLKATFDDRAIFTKEAMTHFHLDEEE
jgi:tetratricopeptide (TPR) repeat protein